MLMILTILLLLALISGGVGHSRTGLAGWSPAGIILLIFVVTLLGGRL